MILLFFTLIFAALDTGLSFAHALEMIPKLTFDPALYLTLHRTLYWGFGTIGAIFDVGVLPLSIALAYKMRHDPVRFRRVTFAAVCYVVAFILWLALINPANIEMKQWSVDSPPASWTTLRDRWEYTHLTRFGLQLLGLGSLVLSALPSVGRESRVGVDRAA